MSTERARRALELMELALDLPSQQVSHFLKQACGADRELLSDVESLLATHRETGEFLPEPNELSTAGVVDPSGTDIHLDAGDVLMDRYRIVALVGFGGMGAVYRANDSRLQRDVAIKVLRGTFASHPQMRERFEREMRSAAAFSHPNVMEIYDLGVHEGDLVAVMEFIEGDTLRELLQAGSLSIVRAIEIAAGVASGLDAAHRRELLHRDIKPENVMVASDDHVKILDFGLARPQAPTEAQSLTRTAMTPGTVPYMSPEQSAGQNLECSTDVFSLGTVLYEMLTGSNPFLGDSAVETLQRVVSSSVTPLSELRSDIPPSLDALVSSMLGADSRDRPTAKQVASELRAIRDTLLSSDSVGESLGTSATTSRSAPLGDPPRTQFARCGEIHIAYQTFGDGPSNLLLVPGFISNIDNYWASSACAHWLRSLGSFARVAMFDKRGTGLSDRVRDLPNMEERVEDVCAVMDAVGFESAAVLGISEGGSLASVFAASYPQRCQALILHGSFAKFSSWFETDEALEGLFDYIRSAWGSGASLPAFAPSFAEDPECQEWWGKFERLGANPSAAIDLMRMNSQIDITRVLPAIQAPTLVINRSKDVLIDPQASEFLSQNIQGAVRYVTECVDHIPFLGTPVEGELSAVRDFLHGLPAMAAREQVLATVLAVQFNTSVGAASAERLRQLVALNRGSAMTQRDGGFVATFEGPVRAIRCAKSIAASVFQARLCIHTGEVALGGDRLEGPAVDKAMDVAGSASEGEVVVTRIVKDIAVDSGLRFSSLEPVDATEGQHVYRVE